MGQFDWNILIRHGHWITVPLGSRRLNICARCSGTVIGFVLFIALVWIIEPSAFLDLSLQYQLLICLLLALPAPLDWLSQAYTLRESTNTLRALTGFLEGIAVALFSTANASFMFKFQPSSLSEAQSPSSGYSERKRYKGR